jgi:hypothetical protein
MTANDKKNSPAALPDHIMCATFPNCYSYCDTTREENGDYKTIARLYFNTLEIKVFANQAKYWPVIEAVNNEMKKIIGNLNTPLTVSATGQTIMPRLVVPNGYNITYSAEADEFMVTQGNILCGTFKNFTDAMKRCEK